MSRKFAEFMENNKNEINEICNWEMNERMFENEERTEEMNDRVKKLHEQFIKDSRYEHDARWLLSRMLEYYDKETIPDDRFLPCFYYSNLSKHFKKPKGI